MNNQSTFCSELINWIENNINERLHLDDIALKSGYSKWHLQRLFKNNTGISLGLFIKRRKLEFAYNDILTKKDTITEIALNYGFESLQGFTRAFTSDINFPLQISVKTVYGNNQTSYAGLHSARHFYMKG